jgi:two-component system chemotaxis sensor kinase CheA
METTLTELEEEAPEDAKAQIGALFRAVHTFKGNSRVLGLANVERVAHLAEDLIGLVRDEGVPLSPEILDLLIRTGDTLRGMLEETADTRADVAPEPSEGLKADLQALIDRLTGKTPAETPAAEAPAPEPEDIAPEPAAEADDTSGDDAEETTEEEAPEPEPIPEAPKAAKAPAFDAGLAGLLDQLDGGSDFDESFFDDDEEETATAEDPAEDVIEPDDTPPTPAVVTVAEVTEGKLQTIDPMYQKIFGDMASDTIGKLAALVADWSDADSPATAQKTVDGLWYAAGQMSLSDWIAPMQAYLDAGSHDKGRTESLLEELRALYKENVSSEDTPADANADTPDGTDVASMFTALAGLYPELADQGMAMRSDTPREDAARRDLSARLRAMAEPFGFIHLLDAIEDLATAGPGSAYQAAELSFYEALLGVERTAPKGTFTQELVAPSKILGAWCSDRIFETLQALRQGLDDRKRSGKDWFPEFETLMRQVHHACLNYKINTASQLTMSLIDLFSRIRIEDQTPDVILLQMGRGFVDTMELVFDALDQGDTPDTSRIEQMFEEASNVCFVASGVVSAKSIETRLGLPPEFHRVMSPESAKSAHLAIEEGLHFYVLRADINDDDALAQGFFEWITSGLVQMITNVTVFLDNATMFDFLVASSLEEDRMMERLTMLDPSGRKLSMVRALEVQAAAENETQDTDGMEISFGGDASDSLALLEAVGAISASHALVDHELEQLSSVDVVREIFDAMRDAGLDTLDGKLRGLLRDRLESYSARIQEISEASAQLSSELSHLQQQSMAQRSRPAEVLLRPLKAYVTTQAKKRGNEASLTHVGGDVVLDQLLIEELRDLLKAIVTSRLDVAHAATRFHISIEAESDHVRLEITDNSPSAADDPALDRLRLDLRRRKGDLRSVALPAGAGTRFHLRVPQHLIVLDGMVVRIGRIRYVLPIDAIQRILESDRLLPVTAATNMQMLNLGDEGLIPVHPLSAWSPPEKGQSHLYVIVASSGRRMAIPVDELLGQQLVKLRQLQGVLASVKDMSGIAVLSGGEVGMVVAVSALASSARAA